MIHIEIWFLSLPVKTDRTELAVAATWNPKERCKKSENERGHLAREVDDTKLVLRPPAPHLPALVPS
jgi:hypothetical protein